MSYCRFSSDNWKCQVYCYGGSDGFYTYVAGNKVVGDVPSLDWELLRKSDDDEALKEFQRQYTEQMAWLDGAERKPIGLPYDGQAFTDPDLESFLRTLTMLKDAGYNVPQYVFDEVRDEIKTEMNHKRFNEKEAADDSV